MLIIFSHLLIGYMSGQLARSIVGIDKPENLTGKRISLGLILAVVFGFIGSVIFATITA